MVGTENKAADYPRRHRSTTIDGIVSTVELITTALILAFTFRAFIMEPFRIPTGSMAETLRGVHYELRCLRCGYKYALGANSFTLPAPRCPACGFLPSPGPTVSVSNGDRILVYKCGYYFADPKRWDVMVFLNPLNPSENYIKRMMAGPGETVEIIDGDIYINGQIAQKPANIQEKLWMPVYDNDYQSFHHEVLSAAQTVQPNGDRPWKQPFENEANSNWDLSAKGPAVFALDSNPDATNTISYNSSIGNDFKATYSYNDSSEYYRRSICSDLMVRFYVAADSQEGSIGAVLKKYKILYQGRVSFSGEMTIEKTIDGRTVKLEHRRIKPVKTPKAIPFKFANVDHRLILEFGDEKLKHDLGRAPDAAGAINEAESPGVKIFGAGKLTLWHIAVFKDIHYTSEDIKRAGPGNPFKVGEDEFFVCGDNSPDSYDSRKWEIKGIGNNGTTYTMGIVPRDYLVGKAVFLYWGTAFRPFGDSLPIIPNISQIHFIQNGSDRELYSKQAMAPSIGVLPVSFGN